MALFSWTPASLLKKLCPSSDARDHMPAHGIGAGRTLEPDHHNPLGHWGGAKPGQFGAGKKRGRGVQEALMVLLVSGTAFTPRRILRRNGDKCDQPRSKQQPEIVGNGRKWSLRLPHPDYLN